MTTIARAPCWLQFPLGLASPFAMVGHIAIVAAGQQPGPRADAACCQLRLGRDPAIDDSLSAQPAEPPYTDPYVRLCGSESAQPHPLIARVLA